MSAYARQRRTTNIAASSISCLSMLFKVDEKNRNKL